MTIEIVTKPLAGALLVLTSLLCERLQLIRHVSMHPFVPAVVRWLRRTRPNVLDAQTRPPHRQLGQPEFPVRRDPGRAVVGQNRLWQTVFAEHLLEDPKDRLLFRAWQDLDSENEPAVGVTDRQWLTAVFVHRQPPALEIHRPDVIRPVKYELWR
jgi:hypothetical protein